MSLRPLMQPALLLAVLSGCTTAPPQMYFPDPPSLLMQDPQELRSLPQPKSLPTITPRATQPEISS